MISGIEKRLLLIRAYRKGIAEGIIRKTVLGNDKQVVLFVKSGADEIYREAAAEYRKWQIWGEVSIGSLQAAAIMLLSIFAITAFLS